MEATLSSNWLVQRTQCALDYIHGGLTMSGVILVLALGSLLAGNQSAHKVLNSLQARYGQVQIASLAEEADKVMLTPEMRAALDSVARRYRVSNEALEPVFHAASVAGREMKIDPLLIVAIIAIESRFNPFAESVYGAQGLMQVIPRFHQDKIPEVQGALFDPKINVLVGTQVLRESIQRNGGLIPGLQQFAGAANDPDQTYANKVLSEKQRLEGASQRRAG